MSEKEKEDIKKMVETAKFLAENDPQGLLLAQNGMNLLKARCDIDKRVEDKPKKTG